MKKTVGYNKKSSAKRFKMGGKNEAFGFIVSKSKIEQE